MPEHLLRGRPADLVIGANVRSATCTDSQADAKQFAASIKTRGLLEAITCHRESMTERDVCDAVEQLALLGVSAAQITKGVAIPRTHVDAASP